MAAGLQATQSANDVNFTCGNLARELNVVFEKIQEFSEFLSTADLTTPPYNMAAEDEATIKSAYADLFELSTIYTGDAALAAEKDFRQFAKLIYGFGF